MPLTTNLFKSIRSRMGFPPKWIDKKIGTKTITVREGTIRKKTDYDDAWFYLCSQNSKLIFDVGANVGGDTLYALLANPNNQIYSIEANPKALSQVADNVIQNQFSERVRFINKFVSDSNNENIKFWTVGTGAAGSRYKDHAKTAAHKNQSINVSSISIDALCEQFGVIPDFIKIDVEGAEYDVLLGCQKCLKNNQTRILVEMHSNKDLSMQDNTNKILKICSNLNYSVWYLSNGDLLKSSEQNKNRGRCHLLLQPEKWAYPNWLNGIKQSTPLNDVFLKEQNA